MLRSPVAPMLLLLACADTTPTPSAPMDGFFARRTLSPSGTWEALVGEDGTLRLRRTGEPEDAARIDGEVDARVAFSADERVLLYARRGDLAETDLWSVELPDGAPVRVTGWSGSEDRPVLSPDGRRLALVSGRTGIASWWVVDLDGELPVGPDAARQLTNVGVERARHHPGQPPAGFVPVPDGSVYAWTGAGLSWVAEGQAYTVTP